MKKYYIVPVTTRAVRINDRSLFEMLGNVNKKLHDRELERIKMTYESDIYNYYNYDIINGYNHMTKMLYEKRVIPEKMIIVDNGSKKIEFFTEEEIECDNDSYLEVFKANPGQVKKYIQKNPLYGKSVIKFIKKGSKDRKVLTKCKNSVKPNN